MASSRSNYKLFVCHLGYTFLDAYEASSSIPSVVFYSGETLFVLSFNMARFARTNAGVKYREEYYNYEDGIISQYLLSVTRMSPARHSHCLPAHWLSADLLNAKFEVEQ